MAVDKLNLNSDKVTFFNVALLKTNELFFPDNPMWRKRLFKPLHDVERQPEPKRFYSVIFHCIEQTDHRIVERKVVGINIHQKVTKKLLGIIKLKMPYISIRLGDIVGFEESPDKHMDFNKGEHSQWLRSKPRG